MADLDYNTKPLIETEGLPVPFTEVGTVRQNVSHVEVVFNDIEGKLEQLIAEAEVVCGVVAWLTSERLLNALAQKEHVSMIVQKEDFLRPDRADRAPSVWKELLQTWYALVPDFLTRYERLPEPIANMSYCGDPTIEGIRCAGQRIANRHGARIHHKFAVFARVTGRRGGAARLAPYAVATGSYNWTDNACKSRENLVVIRDQAIANEYLIEWANICAISEPLDWKAEYVEPEWRIGS